MRLRSLMVDKNDDAAFRFGPGDRTTHEGQNMNNETNQQIYNEYNQQMPFFFTREGWALPLIGHYKGRSAFMICNGPSFAELDHGLLRKPGVITYGINNGPRTFRPTFWTCVDDPTRFIKSIWLDPRITKFVPQSFFEKKIFDNEKWELMNKVVGDCPNVIGFRRNEKLVQNRWLQESTVNWGNNKLFGGGRSVMLPVIRILYLLGFRKVYLLGCDMKMDEKKTYHFDEQREKGAVNCNMSTYKRLKEEYFPQLKPYFDKAGFQVFNCNPESALRVFPFVSFTDAIKEATSELGDVENERTWGMYCKPEEKMKYKVEPPSEEKKNIRFIKDDGEGIKENTKIEEAKLEESRGVDDLEGEATTIIQNVPEQEGQKEN